MIVELIGLAGSGKSTLTKALSDSNNNIRIEAPPSYKKVENFPFYVWNTLDILANLPRIFLDKNEKYPSWNHFISNVLLNGWHQKLTQKAVKGESVIILDQGPVYMITFETLFGIANTESKTSKKFWNRAFHCWAETLDMVIWLDASLPVLVERIRSREIWHSVKDRDDLDAYNYFEKYRQAYESVVSRLTTCSNTLKVFHLDTDQNSLDETVEIVLKEIHQKDNRVKTQEIM
jgi:deoxyadenosine/deoxycytidine kinase